MFLPLGNLLDDSVRRAKISPEIEATKAMGYFVQVARGIWGNEIADQIKPMYIKNQCLTVAVLSSVYAQDIRLRERQVVEQLNEKMKKTVVVKIKCLV